MLTLGRYELHAIDSGYLRLDGGSMFGVVPRVLWASKQPPDELNRIRMAMRCLLAVDRTAGRVILVDTGAGDKWRPEEVERFGLEIDGDRLGSGLRAAGVNEDDVTDVVLTHLHFDHNAGLTRWAADGRTAEPRFRQARHWVHEQHLAHARQPTPKDRGSFMPIDFEAIDAAGLLSCLAGAEPQSAFDDLTWFVAHGHTPFQLLPRFHGDGTGLQFLADLIPTTAHLPLAWVMAFDNAPLLTIAEKQRLYQDCAEGDLILFFQHDPDVAAVRLSPEIRKPSILEAIAV